MIALAAGKESIPTAYMVCFPPGPIFSQEIFLNILLRTWNATTSCIPLI
jgi:hypothetical protein